MADVVSLATRERRTQRVRDVAVFALCAALLGAYLLAFGLPGCLLPRSGGTASPQQTAAETLSGQAGALTDDGVVSGVVSVFDDTHPAVASLDPVLLHAVRAAAVDAAADGIAVVVTSGWRSPEHTAPGITGSAWCTGTSPGISNTCPTPALPAVRQRTRTRRGICG